MNLMFLIKTRWHGKRLRRGICPLKIGSLPELCSCVLIKLREYYSIRLLVLRYLHPSTFIELISVLQVFFEKVLSDKCQVVAVKRNAMLQSTLYCVNKSRLMYAVPNTSKRDRVKVFDTCMHVYSPSPYSNFRVILKKVSINKFFCLSFKSYLLLKRKKI